MTKVSADLDPANDDQNAGFGVIPRYLRGHLTAHEIAVYVALSWRIDKHGECYMRHKRLAHEAGTSVGTARRALDRLRDRGVVSWRPKYGDDGDIVCNVYRLHPEQTPRSHGADPLLRESGQPAPPEQQNENPGTRTQEEPSSADADAIDSEFDGFWRTYPRRVGKKSALGAYRRARKDASEATIAAGLRSQLPDLKGRALDKVPHPTTWLNQRRWEDDPAHAAQPGDRTRHSDTLEGSHDGRFAMTAGPGERLDW